MKIIHITASYKPAYVYGGPIQSVGKLCEALVEGRGWEGDELGDFDYTQDNIAPDDHFEKNEIEVFTTTANGSKELDVEVNKAVFVNGVQVTYFNRWTKDHSHFSPGLLQELRRKILRQDQDDKQPNSKLQTPNSELIIHIHAWWNLVSVLSCLVAKWYQIPVVLSPRGMLTSYTQHNRNSFSKKLIHNLIGKKLLQYCHIHATSEQEKKDVLEIVQPQSITVIPNLVNIKEQIPGIKKTLRADGRERHAVIVEDKEKLFKLIFLSRIEEKKGLELLFNALHSLVIPWSLTIAGAGKDTYIESLKLKAQSLKLSEHIHWIGQVSDQDKFRLMAEHDLLVLTSHNENFANVIIESLSVGTPVLVSKHVGLADYVEENDLGWVCSLVIEDIRFRILKASEDLEKRKRIRNTAPIIISKDFSDEVLVRQYLELYDRMGCK